MKPGWSGRCAVVAAASLFFFVAGCKNKKGTGNGGDGGAEDAQVRDGAVGDSGGPTDGTIVDAGDPDGGQPGNCGEIVTFETGLSPATEIHVAENGNDGTGNGTQGNPYASIQRAVQDASPGAAIRVHQGTYPGGEWIADLSGSAGAPIWIGGAPGENRPVLNAVNENEAMHLVRIRYVVLHDLEVTGAAINGINCDDGGDYANDQATRYVIFRNLYIHDIGSDGNQDCLKLSGVNEFFVLDSEIHDCGGGMSGSGIDHVGCHQGLIARNYMHDLAANAVQTKGGSEDIEIRWNRMVNAGQRALNMGGSTGFQFFRPPLSDTSSNAEARNIRAVANVIEGSYAAIAFVGCVNCVAINNTVVDPDNWIMRILQETTTSGQYVFEPCGLNTVANNIFYFDRSGISTYINTGPNTAADTFTFTHNLWYAHDNPSQSNPQADLQVTETNGIYGQDPAFTTGYEIGGNSPAAGAGTPATVLFGDMNGRCYNTPPSIGAYEVP